MTAQSIGNSINRSPSRCCLFITGMMLTFSLVALAPQTRATCQEGCLTQENTVLGDDALISNTSGSNNTATGVSALLSNTTGKRNVANGFSALFSNQIGIDNTAIGYNALYANTADYNTATGYQALESNTTGSNNTANGLDTLDANTTGNDNTADGALALFSNTTGSNNTAHGYSTLYNNTTGSYNTADGEFALTANVTGAGNTAIGDAALLINSTGSSNIALGLAAGSNITTGSNNIDIGNNGVSGDFAKIRIGTRPIHKNTFIAGIFGVTVPTGVAVLIDNNGHLGTTTSSVRFKEGIQPMDKTSEAILALKPVTFRYKHDLDPQGIQQFGLVAEEVEKVDPDLVARDNDGTPYTVRYDAVNAMLLNEFLKEHRKNEQQEATITALKTQLTTLTARLDQQAEQIQEVSARITTDQTAPNVVLK